MSSSLFSIGEDELDLDDENCLLAACGEGHSVNCITDNSKNGSGLEQNHSSSKPQLLRTKEMEKFNSHYSRRPFESLSNINTSNRVSEKKRTSTDQVQKNSTTSTANGFNAPLAKRFAADNNLSSKPLSGNGASLLRSSSTPAFKNASSTTEMQSSDKTHLSNSSPASRNLRTRDSQLQEFAQHNFRPSNSCESSKRMDPLNKIPALSDPISDLPSKNKTSGFHSPSSCTGLKALHNSKLTDVKTTSPVWQQQGPLRCSPTINNQMRDFPLHRGNTSTPLCNQTERHSPNNCFNKNLNGTRTPEAPLMFRQSAGAGARTPQAHQAVTPFVNRSHNRTPSGIKTPKTRKFPGPAGLLPKLSPGQSLDDTSLVSPLPSMRKRSPIENKGHASQSNPSEDDDFNRDPWMYMHQDFLKNVPLAKRYTIIRAYTEAIQQRLDHGKVPCLCALVKAFSLTEADASVLLKDPTGEIHGTLHRKVLEDFQTELAPGAGLILKHVSVFSPAPRKHYLNITPGNILQIYPPDPQYMSSSQTLASQCTQAGNKREEQRVVIEDEVISEQADCNKETNTTDGRTTTEKEEELIQEDCFEDLLEGLDDDEDFLDEALLV